MTEAFLYLVDLKPPNYNYSTSTSPDSPKARRVHRLLIVLSFYKRIMVMNTGTAHRSCQAMLTLLYHDVTAQHTVREH
jgi:hypothetical protein